MNPAWVYTLASVFIISIFSLAGILFILVKKEFLSKALIYIVSFSAGTLLGGAFIHLLPEAVKEMGFSIPLSLFVLFGIVLFFVLEKIVCWRHCHVPTSEAHPHPLALMNLVGDGLHNFIDGMIIAGSFLVSVPLGISTSIAVIAHEIPQEISDYGVLVYGGFGRFRALMLNFVVSASAFLGAILVLTLSTKVSAISSFLVPFTAGGFIYIAGSDLIPELKKNINPLGSALQLFFLLLGILLMLALALFE
jgi:zinc and cadmium transporter